LVLHRRRATVVLALGRAVCLGRLLRVAAATIALRRALVVVIVARHCDGRVCDENDGIQAISVRDWISMRFVIAWQKRCFGCCVVDDLRFTIE